MKTYLVVVLAINYLGQIGKAEVVHHIIIVIARVGRSDLKFQAHFQWREAKRGTKLSRRI